MLRRCVLTVLTETYSCSPISRLESVLGSSRSTASSLSESSPLLARCEPRRRSRRSRRSTTTPGSSADASSALASPASERASSCQLHLREGDAHARDLDRARPARGQLGGARQLGGGRLVAAVPLRRRRSGQ